MPLDHDRIAEALLEGTKALIEKALAPVLAEGASLRARNHELEIRLAALEGRDLADLIEDKIREARADADAATAAVSSAVETCNARVSEFEALVTRAEASDLAMKAEIDALRAAEPLDTTGFATKEEVEAVRSVIPDVAGFAKWADIEMAVAGVEQRAADALSERAAEVVAAIPDPPDLSSFAVKSEVEALRERVEGIVIPEPVALPDLSGLATKDEVAEVRAAIPEIPEAPEVEPLVDAAVARAVAAIPSAEAKDWGPEISAIIARIEAIKMPEVIHGKDGNSLADARLNEDGELIIKMTNGETANVGKVRGADGFGFDDMGVEDDDRSITIVFTKGDREQRFTFEKGAIIDRGVWRAGVYQKGDAVTWAGSLWIAQRETEDKPETSDAWRLAVKKGRDAKSPVKK